MTHRIQIGTASIILILTILCLAVFSLLSLSGAASSLAAAKRYADAVTAFYQADTAGQVTIHRLSRLLEEHSTVSAAIQAAAEEFPEEALLSLSDSGQIICELPLADGRVLHLELNPLDQSILANYLYHASDYEIDRSLPVWVEYEQ